MVEHDPAKWPEFRTRYTNELRSAAAQTILADLVKRAQRGRVTRVYGSRAAETSDVGVVERVLRRRIRAAEQKR